MRAAEVELPRLNAPLAPKEVQPSSPLPSGEGGESSVDATAAARWAGVATRRLRGESGTWRIRNSGVVNPTPTPAADPRQPTLRKTVSARQALIDDSSHVRPASQLVPIDPFDDPFGDKARQPQRSPIAAPVATPAPATPAPPQVQESPTTAPKAKEPSSEAPPSADPPRLLTPAPPIPDSQHPSPEDSGGRHVYNGRDCLQQVGSCRQAREYLQDNPLSKISLDITPHFTLAKLDRWSVVKDLPSDYQKQLEQRLSSVSRRVFRDRRGQVVAEGRITDYRNGRVLILEDSGEIKRIAFSELADDDVCFVTAWWSIPNECVLGDEEYVPRDWLALTMTWKASAVCHKPLYFEEVQLERYGHTPGPVAESFLSGAHFFLNIATLPYKAGIHPPNECQYPLGYYRPGSCAPWLVPPIPLSVRGGLLAAGTYLGIIYAFP